MVAVHIFPRHQKILDIPGDYLEGGGQILRTAAALSCILNQPIRVYNIRSKRPNPGLKPQHLHILKNLARLFKAETKGLELNSKEIVFSPSLGSIQETALNIDMGTAAAIGLFLQPLLLAASFRACSLSLRIKGGTCGLGAIPVDYYPLVIFPVLSRSGVKANLEIIKRGYYPKGGGEAAVEIKRIANPSGIDLSRQGKLTEIKGISIASMNLKNRDVAERQASQAKEYLRERYPVPVDIKVEYTSTLSAGSEINLYAYTDSGCILWSDARGELKKKAEDVANDAAGKLVKEIDSGAACDLHLADNLMPWLVILGGRVVTSELTLHTRTNIWVCELFFGEVFTVQGNSVISLGLENAIDGYTKGFIDGSVDDKR